MDLDDDGRVDVAAQRNGVLRNAGQRLVVQIRRLWRQNVSKRRVKSPFTTFLKSKAG